MKKIITVNSIGDLPAITEVIHDCWFEKKDIVFNQELASVDILFEKEIFESKKVLKDYFFFKKAQFSVAEYVLKISNAENCQIEDKERVERYDFNKIKYNSENRIISILTGIPIDIKVRVKTLSISIEDTERVIGTKNTFTFFK